ncbi:MAG: 16S rRNA (cytidine(1402)-2'-O)-methyltransferase [Desulfobulbaceae bacterium]|nr:16S rRNA (cytidine(1402)-2'-O)-methyltransferase [Desulfobulbaceae bacterium]
MKSDQQTGTLYIVATPIGNLEDISIRAKRILGEVSLIACEDTRHTRKLLNHLQIKTPLTSYYREKEKTKADILLSKLLDGQDIALVSDAGTPALSDPGSVLVQQSRRAGITVIPVPGPSALTAAISASGIDETGFFFGGFPPSKKNTRRTFFKKLAQFPCPLVFYESPHRIKSCLQDCIAVFGERHGLLFKELTKMYEKSYEGTLTQLLDVVKDGIRGELVLIVHGHSEDDVVKPDNLTELLSWYRKQPDMTLKEAVRSIAADLNLPRNMVYQQALAVWKSDK